MTKKKAQRTARSTTKRSRKKAATKPATVADVVAAPPAEAPIDAEEALRLRRAGMNYPLIAKMLSRDERAVRDAVEARLLELTAEPLELQRVLEQERLDKLLMAVWGNATKGDLEAVDRVLKIIKQRAALASAGGGNPAGDAGALGELPNRLGQAFTQVRDRARAPQLPERHE